MLFSSTRNLIRHHKENRIYVTEINYSRNDEPSHLFLFLTEYNIEIRMDISSILKKKRLRSREETMFHLKNSRGQTMLLFLDHRRGNHYIYCTAKTYKRLHEQSKLTTPQYAVPSFANEEVAATNSSSFNPTEIL